MDVLATLFGSASKVKILKLFIFNPDRFIDAKEVSSKCKIAQKLATHDIAQLEAMDFVKGKSIAVTSESRRKKGARVKIWRLNMFFPFLKELKNILSHEVIDKKDNIAKKFKDCGKIKLIVIAGVFLNSTEGRVDLTVVGDNLKKVAIDRAVRSIESDLGRELNYAVFSTEDFNDRLYSADRFVRDILDFPHECVINKIGL